MKLIKEWKSRKGSQKLVERSGEVAVVNLAARNAVYELTDAEVEEFRRKAKAGQSLLSQKASKKRKSA